MSDLPVRVRAFLDEHIFSASQLEVLLLLHARPGEPMTLAQVSAEARLPTSSIGPWLDAFVYRRLLVHDGGSYCWRPTEPEAQATVDEVAEVYRRRRTTVGRYLYARGQDPLTRFADAFRFRRDPGTTPSAEEL